MTVTLDPHTEQTIQREIDLGHYADVAAVIAHAISLLEDQDAWFVRNRNALNERLQQGLDEIERGEGIPGDEARAMLRKERAQLRA